MVAGVVAAVILDGVLVDRLDLSSGVAAAAATGLGLIVMAVALREPQSPARESTDSDPM
jgi:hypothetical protein